MGVPFVYHSVRRTRTEAPRAYSNYKLYKPFLRVEFGRTCVYCRLPDGVKGKASFGVDHYKPRRLFPQLACDYANLFYACNGCNSAKGPFWPTHESIQRGYYIPNPCDHVIV